LVDIQNFLIFFSKISLLAPDSGVLLDMADKFADYQPDELAGSPMKITTGDKDIRKKRWLNFLDKFLSLF